MQQAVLGAMILAMAGAFFGAVSARLFWAEDLKHAQRMRAIWDKTEGHMKSTIESQRRTIDMLQAQLGHR